MSALVKDPGASLTQAAPPDELEEGRTAAAAEPGPRTTPRSAAAVGAPTGEGGTPVAEAAAVIGEGSCSARIESRPKGAAVVVDGTPAGVTPVTVYGVWCGRPMSVLVAAEHFEPWQRTIRVAEGSEPTVRASLRRPRAIVHVDSNPSGARVFVGGRRVATTPAAVELPAHARTLVELRKPGFLPARDRVVATPGARNHVSFELRWAGLPGPR